MAELTEALAAALVQRGELQAENAKLRKLHEYDEYSLTRLRAELSSLHELYADRDRDLAFEFKCANDAEAKALAQSEDVQMNWLSPIEAAGLKAEVARLRDALAEIEKYNPMHNDLDAYLSAIASWGRGERPRPSLEAFGVKP